MTTNQLLKATATAWNKSVAKKMTATAVVDGVVRSANATTWKDNYPMEQVYEKYFNVVWTQGYTGSGTFLDPATWGDHPRAGDSVNFHGLWGFDRKAMRDFVAGGVIQDIQIEVMFDDPSHAGNPEVHFFPHVYTSKPSAYDGWNANTSFKKIEYFKQTGSDYRRWVKLPVGAWLSGSMGGVVAKAPAATAANSARFAGKTSSHSLNAFTTRLFIKVLK